MAEINYAWKVLSDPAKRAADDLSLERSRRSAYGSAAQSGGSASASASASNAASAVQQLVIAPTPSKFPWRFLAVMGVLGIAFVLVNAAFTKPGSPLKPDNLIEAGSCVDIADNGDAIEVLCNGANDGVVHSLISFDAVCTQGTESHRDRQGMGQVCVRLAGSR